MAENDDGLRQLVAYTWVMRRFVLAFVLVLLTGCTTVKPSARGTGEAKQTLERPVVVIGGWADPGFGATHVAKYIRKHSGDDRVIAVHPGYHLSFDAARRSVTRTVEKHFPSGDPETTVEVDVIGISMGGLIARHAVALGHDELGPELDARRLFTISSPHSGSRLANAFGFYARGTGDAMRAGSPFLTELGYREQIVAQPYELVTYGRSRDGTVGLPGMRLPDHLRGTTLWLNSPWYEAGHGDSNRDKRILNDILRRLGVEVDEDNK